MYIEPADLWLGAYVPILFVDVMFNVLQVLFMSTQKFVTIGIPTLTQVPGIGAKTREYLKANEIDLAKLIEAEQASTRVEFIYRLTGWGYRRGGLEWCKMLL